MRQDFTPFVYTVDGMTGRDVRAADKRLTKLLTEKWRREYSEMVEFIQEQMSLAVARVNTLLLR